ncbi:MAG: hypothetical protein J4O03_16655, partial [Chloroflexi bacterium]|nr:hypothetical protein [Chloroflexota bacterium]
MALNPPIERLRLALTALMALEGRIQQTVANLDGGVSAYPAAKDILARLGEMTCTHLDALSERLQITPDDGPKVHVGG